MKIKIREKEHEIPMFSERVTRRMDSGVVLFIIIFILVDIIEVERGRLQTMILTGLILFIVVYGCLSHFLKKCLCWSLERFATAFR